MNGRVRVGTYHGREHLQEARHVIAVDALTVQRGAHRMPQRHRRVLHLLPQLRHRQPLSRTHTHTHVG